MHCEILGLKNIVRLALRSMQFAISRCVSLGLGSGSNIKIHIGYIVRINVL
jgi:hypothetical protein